MNIINSVWVYRFWFIFSIQTPYPVLNSFRYMCLPYMFIFLKSYFILYVYENYPVVFTKKDILIVLVKIQIFKSQCFSKVLIWTQLHTLINLYTNLYKDSSVIEPFQFCNTHSLPFLYVASHWSQWNTLFIIFAHHGSPWYDNVYFNSASSSTQWVDSLLKWLTKLSVLNVSHYATMNNKTSVKLNWSCFKNRSMIGRIENVRVQSD